MNSKSLLLACFFSLVSCFLFLDSLHANPQTLTIKSKEKKAQESLAVKESQKISLSNIEDPEARAAIKALFDALGLPYQK